FIDVDAVHGLAAPETEAERRVIVLVRLARVVEPERIVVVSAAVVVLGAAEGDLRQGGRVYGNGGDADHHGARLVETRIDVTGDAALAERAQPVDVRR